MELSGSVYDYLQGIIVCVLLILQKTASTPVSECTVNAVNAVPAVNARRTSASDQVSVMPIHMNPHGKSPPLWPVWHAATAWGEEGATPPAPNRARLPPFTGPRSGGLDFRCWPESLCCWWNGGMEGSPSQLEGHSFLISISTSLTQMRARRSRSE